jgi:uncharacterized protein YlxW (UPF0749 family)
VLNGTETDETKQKSKQVEKLIDEQAKLAQEISSLKAKKQSLKNAADYYREAKKEHERLKNNQTIRNPQEKAFLGTNTSGTK